MKSVTIKGHPQCQDRYGSSIGRSKDKLQEVSGRTAARRDKAMSSVGSKADLLVLVNRG